MTFLSLQFLIVSHEEEKKAEIIEEGLKRDDEKGFPTSLLRGEYNEEESARSFQEALRQWRGETIDGAGVSMSEDAMSIPARPGELHRHGCRHTDIHIQRGKSQGNK